MGRCELVSVGLNGAPGARGLAIARSPRGGQETGIGPACGGRAGFEPNEALSLAKSGTHPGIALGGRGKPARVAFSKGVSTGTGCVLLEKVRGLPRPYQTASVSVGSARSRRRGTKVQLLRKHRREIPLRSRDLVLRLRRRLNGAPGAVGYSGWQVEKSGNGVHRRRSLSFNGDTL